MHWIYCDIRNVDPAILQQVYARLSPSRKEHIDRLRKQEDRARSLAAELLLQQLLGEHYGIHDAVLHRKSNGQPYLTGCELQVSISHSHNLVACAVSHQPVGIDAEHLRPVSPALCRRVCVEEEMGYLLGDLEDFPAQNCQSPEFLRRFFEIWTAKEAYFKKCGTGITNLKAVNTLNLSRQTHLIEDYVVQIVF